MVRDDARLRCSEGFVNKTDDYSDDSPLDEVSHSLFQSEFQPDVQVHVIVQHKCAYHENANENAEARRDSPFLDRARGLELAWHRP